MLQKSNHAPSDRAQLRYGDVADVQPKANVHKILGRCLLEDGKELPCEAYDASISKISICCKFIPTMNSVVIVCLDNVGIVRGRVLQSTDRGFLLGVEISDDRRSRIAARLDWHAARAAETAEQRAAPRIVPINCRVDVRLGEDLVFPGRILDLSMTGAAIATDPCCRPYVGSLVKVGKRYASVVRAMEKGFAVQFKLPLIGETFNEQVII